MYDGFNNYISANDKRFNNYGGVNNSITASNKRRV